MSREKEFNRRYSPEFKIAVIMDMRENHLITEQSKQFDADKRGAETPSGARFCRVCGKPLN